MGAPRRPGAGARGRRPSALPRARAAWRAPQRPPAAAVRAPARPARQRARASVQPAPRAHPMAIRAHHRLTYDGLTARATPRPDPPHGSGPAQPLPVDAVPASPPRDAAPLGLDTNIPAGGIPQCHPRCPGAARRAQTLPTRRAPHPTVAAGRPASHCRGHRRLGAPSPKLRQARRPAPPKPPHATGGTSTTGTPARALTACATEPSTRSMARSRRSPMTMADAPSRSAAARICSSASP